MRSLIAFRRYKVDLAGAQEAGGISLAVPGGGRGSLDNPGSVRDLDRLNVPIPLINRLV